MLHEECQKSSKMWLVTRQGMERLYGKEKVKKDYI
nr:helix-turn-helix domain-containing protein [Veillonella montpellierensis]